MWFTINYTYSFVINGFKLTIGSQKDLFLMYKFNQHKNDCVPDNPQREHDHKPCNGLKVRQD